MTRGPTENPELRNKAERILELGRSHLPNPEFDSISRLLHELQVHQAELEIQNEELRNTQEELERAHRKHRDLFDFAPVGYLNLDTHGRVREVNLAGAELLGGTRKGLRNSPLHLYVRPDFHRQFYLHRQEVLEGGRNAACELEFQRKDGSRFFASLHSSPLQEPDGTTVCVTAMTDVTARRQAEQALRDSELRFRALVEQAAEAFFLINERGEFLEINERACEQLGYARDELLQLTVTDVDVGEPERGTAPTLTALETAEELTLESVYRRRDDTRFPVEIRVGRVDLECNPCVLALVRDITERKQAQAALQDAKTAAEAANRAKSEFLANMSHEIRTPLNGVFAALTLLEDAGLSHTERRFLEMGRTAAKSLLTVIDDILDFSRIEAGKLRLEERPFSPAEILASSCAVLAFEARRKGLELTWEVGAEVPEQLSGDPGRLRQVLINLLGNAVKFTERGSVRVRAERVAGPEDPSGCHCVEFSVTDTGIGIPAEQIERLFESFSQVDSSSTRRFGGAGLGLAICKGIVAGLGGEIRAHSRPGAGSTFSFRLHLEAASGAGPQPPATPKRPSSAAPERRLRVLLAEDNQINRELAVASMERLGWQVVAAADGHEALRAWEAHPFDLILMDVQMPGIDGFEATRVIRARETDRPTPIVALTAHAMEGDRQRCLAAGMDGYVSKPLDFDSLLRQVQGLLQSPESPAPVEPVPGLGADPVLDCSYLLETLGGEGEDLAPFVDTFRALYPDKLAELRAAHAAGDAAQLAANAHGLRGTLLVFRAHRAIEQTARIEALAGSGDLAGVTEVLQRLELELTEVMRELEAVVAT